MFRSTRVKNLTHQLVAYCVCLSLAFGPLPAGAAVSIGCVLDKLKQSRILGIRSRLAAFAEANGLRKIAYRGRTARVLATPDDFVHVPNHLMKSYLEAVRADTIEVILEEGHLAVRVDAKLYHMVGSIVSEPFLDFIRKNRNDNRIFGINLPATAEERAAIVAYFESARAEGRTNKTFKSNCSLTTCAALDAAGLGSPTYLKALRPAIAAKVFAEKPENVLGIVYDKPENDKSIARQFRAIALGTDLVFAMLPAFFGVLAVPGVWSFVSTSRDNSRRRARHDEYLQRRTRVVHSLLDRKVGEIVASDDQEVEIRDLADWLISDEEAFDYPFVAAASMELYSQRHPDEMRPFLAALGGLSFEHTEDEERMEYTSISAKVRSAFAYAILLEIERAQKSRHGDKSLQDVLEDAFHIQFGHQGQKFKDLDVEQENPPGKRRNNIR